MGYANMDSISKSIMTQRGVYRRVLTFPHPLLLHTALLAYFVNQMGKETYLADDVEEAMIECSDKELRKRTAVKWRGNTSNTVQCLSWVLESRISTYKRALQARYQLLRQANPFLMTAYSFLNPPNMTLSTLASPIVSVGCISTQAFSVAPLKQLALFVFQGEHQVTASTNPCL